MKLQQRTTDFIEFFEVEVLEELIEELPTIFDGTIKLFFFQISVRPKFSSTPSYDIPLKLYFTLFKP